MYRYTIILTPEPKPGGYSVAVPALPGCYSQGDTVDEAPANIRDAIGLHLDGMLRDGEEIPADVAPIVTAVDAEPTQGSRPTSQELAAIDNASAWDGRTW